jgi:hypothetical protein
MEIAEFECEGVRKIAYLLFRQIILKSCYMKEGKFSASFEGKSYRISYDSEAVQSNTVYSIYLDDAPLIRVAGTHFHFLQPSDTAGNMTWGVNVGSPKEQELKQIIAQALEAHLKGQPASPVVQH